MDGTSVPIGVTEYKSAVPQAKVELPKFMNTLGIPDIQTPERLEDLGHAGRLFIRGRDGVCKYDEYGRYDPADTGLTRK